MQESSKSVVSDISFSHNDHHDMQIELRSDDQDEGVYFGVIVLLVHLGDLQSSI